MALKNLGIQKEMLQLIYNLNKKAKVVVKTPYAGKEGRQPQARAEQAGKQDCVCNNQQTWDTTWEFMM